MTHAGLEQPEAEPGRRAPGAAGVLMAVGMLNGALYCMTAVLPAMRAQQGGLVINIAAWLGRWVGYLGGAAYGASKHAMATITHHLNLEEGMNGIRGCVIYPGEVATPILKTRPLPPSQEDVDRMLEALRRLSAEVAGNSRT